MAGWSVVGWMPSYIKEQFNLSQGTAGMSTTLYLNIAALIGMIIGGTWADRWSRTNPRARILVPIIGLSLAAPGVLLITTAPVLAVALGGLVLYGMTRYFSDPNMMPIFCLLVDPRYRATSWGISSFFSCLIGGAGIYIGGMLRDAHVNIRHIFEFAAINVALSALLLIWIYRRQRKASSLATPVV